MKILHVSQGYAPALGGTERTIQSLSEELVRQFGDEVTVFTTNCTGGDGFYHPGRPALPAGWVEMNGVRVRRFPVARSLGWAARAAQYALKRAGLAAPERLRALADGPIVPGLARAIREYPAEVTAASSFPLLHMFVAQQAARRAGRPCIFYGALHPEDEEQFQRPMIYHAIRAADHYVAFTDYEARYVIQRGASPQRVTVIGLGVDAEPFRQITAVQARQRLGLEGDYPLVGFIGQVVPHKGVDTLARAMPRVWQRHPEARLLIAGARRPFAAQLDAMIASWPAGFQERTRVVYDFPPEEKPWLYTALDIYAYPSGYESFGIGFFEAWASGKPVIGCRKGAIPAVVRDGEDGILVEYQDDEALAAAIDRLLADRPLAARMGAAGQRKTLAEYTWPAVARRFRDLFSQVLDRSSPPSG